MTEADLALRFIDYFEGFDIYKEVPGGGGIIDIVAVKTGIRTAIEVKVHLSFDVMHQAFQSRMQNHYAYAAVPLKHSRLHPAQDALCRHYGIGVMGYIETKQTVSFRNMTDVELDQHGIPRFKIVEIIRPVFNRHARKIYLHDYMKRSQAGSQCSRMTAFGYFVECFTDVVKKYRDGVEPKELYDCIAFKHYRTLTLFRNAAILYCRTDVIKNVDFIAGRFHYRRIEEAR